MSESKRTPGPWSFDNDWTRIPTVFGADRRQIVATVEKHARMLTNPGTKRILPERAANARLIAAAPELLEALSLMLIEVSAAGIIDAKEFGWPNAVGKARAAIAKATGDMT